MKTLSTRTNLSALNDQQRKAVLSKEKRVLVLAGAGSGKTNTLLQKINYLIDDEQADSKSILAITFTKNAANEMIDRMILSADKSGFYKKVMETNGVTQREIGVERKKMLQKYPWLNQITIKTFHSLCYKIMRDEGVNVFDNKFKIVPKTTNNSSDFTGNTASETESEIAQKVAIKLSENSEYLIALKRYVLDYLVDYIREDEENSEFRPEGKFFTTLKGEAVRSKSEQYISDWLFRNNIDYEYERKERVSKSAFHPDFFIPSANIYLEHVSNLSYPTFWKEMELKKAGITCVKTFDKATHNSAVFNQMLNKVIKGRISSDLSSATVLHYHEEFGGFKKELNKFFRSVLDVKGAIKNSNKSIEDIAKAAAKSKHERVRLFYQVALPIIKGYYEYCVNKSYLDFDGLIEYSLKLFKEHEIIRNRYQDQYKYVMVDEFQDVNNQQVEFLKHLVNEDSQLFCVGDDWQSIYGFRGSEIDYIVNFKEHFKQPEIITLKLNYRSSDHIVKASNEVIKKNRFQVAKDITAVKKGGSKIEVNYAEVEGETESFIWEKIQQHLQEGVSPEEILILYRRSAMKNIVQESLYKSGVNVQFKTIHGAKGLEAQVVFILGLNSAPGGFPDPWMQDKIYHIIKKSAYDTLLEEERRLFYVALTRAKSHLYLMSQKGSVSEFVKDIPKELMLINENQLSGIELELAICSSCNSKVDDHYKFCPECGKSVNEVKDEDKVQHFEESDAHIIIKEKINNLPLKYVGNLDVHIYKARLINKRAYEPWSANEDNIFCNCCNQFTVRELSELFGRSEGGIESRLKELDIN
jgi:DNA helicase-4